jgi:integrase
VYPACTRFNMSDNSFKFGKRKLEDLVPPTKGKRATYHDSAQHGLSLRITSTGSMTFIVRCRIDGVPEYKTLGKFPALTVENARKAAQDFLAKVARGENPAKDRRENKRELTLNDAFELYMGKHVREHGAIRTIEEYERMYKLHVSQLGKRKLSAVSFKELDRLHASIGKHKGKYIANRVVAVLRSLYTWLGKKRHYIGENPAYGITMFKEHSRDRFLQADELPRFFNSLALEENHGIRDYVLLSLLTGARKQNMLAMRWDEIDFDNESWTIPLTKNQESATIPLIPAAIDILRDRQAIAQDMWVFPSYGKTGHMSDPKKGWKRIIDRAEIADLRIHDLRRSMGSWQAINQTSLTVIAKSLGQKSTQAAAIYSRLSLDPVRESMEQAARSMLEHGGQIEKAKKKVVQFRK